MSSVNVYVRESSPPSPGKHLDCPITGLFSTLAFKALRARNHESGLDFEAVDGYLDTKCIRLLTA